MALAFAGVSYGGSLYAIDSNCKTASFTNRHQGGERKQKQKRARKHERNKDGSGENGECDGNGKRRHRGNNQ